MNLQIQALYIFATGVLTYMYGRSTFTFLSDIPCHSMCKLNLSTFVPTSTFSLYTSDGFYSSEAPL